MMMIKSSSMDRGPTPPGFVGGGSSLTRLIILRGGVFASGGGVDASATLDGD